ncbi:hybrid sensor histidine kinase/response regulator [Hyalangium gracile]|uniref:hybrid sensor histidine kinase/response regulator n=1 Tax=Hyalangium gracile TaxID=394092 RepID=UPI001CCF7E7D|nr:ATP-binding protein [Hyalangium gracile]
MTRAELARALQALETDPTASEQLRHLVRELQRHQLGLEEHNRQLQETTQALEGARNRYLELYDSAPMAYVSLDERGFILEINLTGAAMLRQERSSLPGRPFSSFVDPADRQRFLAHLRRCAEGETLSTELGLRIGESRIEARLHSAPCPHPWQSQRLCWTAIMDITELRQVQFRLSLSERLAAVGTIAAGIAHEINNPLAFLMSSLDIASQALRPGTSPAAATAPESRASGSALKALANAQNGAERIQDIMKGLASFSLPSATRTSRVDVQQVLELSVKLAQGELRHRARLVRDYVKVPEVVADAGRLCQVFLNLLVNAAASIPEGAADRNEVRLRIRPSEQSVLVQVRDTGEGMSPQVRDRVFDPFFVPTKEGQGPRLGLAISHSLVSELGGTITVESHPGVGSTFSIRLPAAPPVEEPAPAPAAQGPNIVAPRGRILIVDDEHRFGQTLQLLLGRAHEVSYTPSAREALGWLQAGRRYDAILCDLMMAEVTGKQFYDALCLQAPELARRVIFMTGGAYTPASAEFVAKMSNPLLTKPFKTEVLERLLSSLLPTV